MATRHFTFDAKAAEAFRDLSRTTYPWRDDPEEPQFVSGPAEYGTVVDAHPKRVGVRGADLPISTLLAKTTRPHRSALQEEGLQYDRL